MFFAPPKVKSLSRYAEYGAYLGGKHFLVMLALAITAHVAVIAIYSMVPKEEIVRIPVRVLNIKLSGGSSGSGAHAPMPAAAPVEAAPSPEAPVANEQPMASMRENDPETAIDKELDHEHKPATKPQHHTVLAGAGKTVRPAQKRQHSHEMAFSTPKKYVRETDGTASKAASLPTKPGTGNGTEVVGVKGGTEVVTRYTQTISQWIQNHQDVAKAICNQVKATSGQCHVSGQAVVRLRINRDGHITYKLIDHTSGSEMVDDMVLAMVTASDPVPSVPNDYPGDNQLEFLIAVQPNLSEH